MKIAITLAALLFAILPLQLHAAPKVVPLEAENMNALKLDPFEPWPDSFVISGVSEHAEKELHRGEFIVSLYEAKPALLDMYIPFTIDEFVWVLDGELILTHEDGGSETYIAGDTLLVPKGFKGTWEMRGNYREMVVIETRANDTGDGFFKIAGSTIAGWFRDTPEILPLKAKQLKRAELQPAKPTAADLELTDDPDSWKDVGTTRLYAGEFIVELYSSPPAIVDISTPFPYDEFVWMLEGELVPGSGQNRGWIRTVCHSATWLGSGSPS